MAITYDEMGNPLSDGTWTYTWEHGRQLAAMTNGSTIWTYTYDANGMRTSRSNGTDTYTYVYNGSKLMQMTVGTNTLTFTYDGSGNPSTVTLNGTTYYYITNLQGDVNEIRTSSGTKVCDYNYDAWGKVVSVQRYSSDPIAILNPLLYRGYVYDRDTGLYYLQSRYYNPAIGRFINADAFASTGQGVLGNNMFAYCGNNPVCYSDPSGNIPGKVIFPVCIGSGNKAVSMKSDHVENSDELLDYVMTNYLPYTSSTVYITVEYLGTYTHVNDNSANRGFAALGIAALAIPFLIPGVKEYALATKILQYVGTASTLYGSTAFLPPSELQDRDYSQYRVTITWSETTNVVGYPNVFVTTSYSIEMWLLWDDDDRSNPYWYLQSSNIQEGRDVVRIY